MVLARRRVKNPEVQNFFRMPVACAIDQSTNRLIVCDTHRWRLQIYEKDSSTRTHCSTCSHIAESHHYRKTPALMESEDEPLPPFEWGLGYPNFQGKQKS